MLNRLRVLSSAIEIPMLNWDGVEADYSLLVMDRLGCSLEAL
jgi:hypothetical protein